MTQDWINIIVGVLLIVGGFFSLVAAIGINRLPDMYTRMHAASKAGTVGGGLALFAMAIYSTDLADATRAIAGVVFLFLTAPISAHLLAKAAYAVGYNLSDQSVINEMAKPKKIDE